MALIVPNSRIEFMTGVPFDPNYENTMYFTDLTEQNTYFASKISHTVENSSYQRVSSGYIKVGWVVDTLGGSVINQLYNANYMRFKNTNFENKWFYAFIDRVEYINNNTVGVYYHLDVLQTWHFEYSFNECFIERQHTETDNFGENTIPENLEHGEYVISNQYELNYTPCAVVVTAGDMSGNYQAGSVIQGLNSRGDWFSGVHYYTFALDDPTAVTSMNNMLEQAYTSRDKQNTIIAIFTYIQYFIDNQNPAPVTHYSSIPKDGTGYLLGSYHVRNKKLATYPYNLLYVTNHQGSHMELRYEFFNDPDNCLLKIWGNKSVNPALMIYPSNYKKNGDNFDEMMQLSGFPMCSWVNDAYKAWVAQNGGTIAAGIIGTSALWAKTFYNASNDYTVSQPLSLVNTGRNGGYMKEAGMFNISDETLNSGAAALASTVALLGKVADHYVQPPVSHGNNNGNCLFQSGQMTFVIHNKHIRQEYASIIDKYFDMYGYAIHRAGIPNRNARPCYTFVKTVGCSVDGNVPVTDLRIIENIFNKGVRFWRVNATFGIFDANVNYNYPS